MAADSMTRSIPMVAGLILGIVGCSSDGISDSVQDIPAEVSVGDAGGDPRPDVPEDPGATTDPEPASDLPDDVGITDDVGMGDSGLPTVDLPGGEAFDLVVTEDSGPAFPPPEAVGCVTSVVSGKHVFPCDGLDFDVSVPEACLQAACGLVVDVHGLTCDAKQQDNNTRMRELGKQYGYIVVQPNANPPPPLSSWNQGSDNDRILAFMQQVVSAWHVDPDRVHFTGFSQGGFMTWRFVCDHSDLIASAAPAAGCSDYFGTKGCTFTGDEIPAVEIPILYMHGTKDGLNAYLCAEKQQEAIIAGWDMEEVEVVSSDADHTWTRYTNVHGTVFEFVSHDYAASSDILDGHCFPGSTDFEGGEPGQLFGYACLGENAFTWGEIAIQFFIDHPRE